MDLRGLIFSKTRKPVPLSSIEVTADIKDTISDVSSSLTYLHQENEPLEAVFVFPVDEDSAVYHFEADIAGRKIVAECQDKDLAKETYEEAKDEGYTAFYLAEDASAGDMFKCHVGNLPANKPVIVTLSYVTQLKYEADESVRFFLPTLLNPRYSPPGEPLQTTAPISDTPKTTPHTFDFSGTVHSSKGIRGINDTISYITWQFLPGSKQKAKVMLAKHFAYDHDLTFNILYLEPRQSSMMYEYGNPESEGFLKNDAIMVNVFPELCNENIDHKHEFIFVIDRSGSMQGSKISAAREALLLFLKSLPLGCQFNVVSFGSRYSELFDGGCVEYNEDSLAAACNLQSTLNADYGGTEILAPLTHIYSQKITDGFTRMMFILTDGQVRNTRDVIKLVKQNASNTRVFTVGIGEGASTALVKGAARAGRGRAEFVSNTDNLQGKVVSLLRTSMSATLKDLQICCNIDITPVPVSTPLLSNGESVTLYGLVKQKVFSGQKITIDICGKSGGKGIKESVELILPEAEGISQSIPIHRLLAKTRIKELEDEELVKGTDIAEMTLWSTTASVVSRHTAFVAFDKTGGRKLQLQCRMPSRTLACGRAQVGMQMMSQMAHHGTRMSKLLKAAVAVSSMAEGVSVPRSSCQTYGASYGTSSLTLVPPSSCLNYGASYGTSSLTLGRPAGATRSRKHPNFAKADGYAANMTNTDEHPTGLTGLVSLQTFEGYWKMCKQLATILGCKMENIQRKTPVKNETIWATILSLAWLEKKCTEQKAQWEMLAEKAYTWLSKQDLEGNTIPSLTELAKQEIKDC